ncbi:MAG: hypothetical protein ABI607_02860 [Betaproteobacteria bacterium]
MSQKEGNLEFAFRIARNGDVSILRHAQVVTTLRASKARDFLAEVDAVPFAEQQQVMARLTGNYKRGNERRAAEHPRNRVPRDG